MRNGVLLLACIFSTAVAAQSYSFKNYTTHDGLVQTNITDIKQDRKGNIWIGTNGGLSVFDGKNFTNYDDHDRLQSLRINALLCDSAGAMWVATRNGLLKYTTDFEVVFQPDASGENIVTCLTSNTQNKLFFVCNNVLYQMSNGRPTKFHINGQIENQTTLAAFDRDDNLWIVTTDLQVYKKTGSTVTAIRTPFTPAEKKHGIGFMRLLGKEGPSPYFVTNFGTYFVKDDSLQPLARRYPQLMRAGVGAATYVLEENDLTVWAGGVVGFLKLSDSTTTRFNGDNGFTDNSVSCLFTDREHNLWVGCTYNGVYKLGNEALFHINPSSESINLKHVSDIVPLPGGKTLLSTWGKGLFLQGVDTVYQLQLPPPVRYITTLLSLGSYTYIGWFGSGIWKLDNKTFAVTQVPRFARYQAVNRMYRAGNYLLITTLDDSCYLTDTDFNIKAAIKIGEDYAMTVLRDKIYGMTPQGRVDEFDNSLKLIRKNLFPEISSRITQLAAYRDHFIVGSFGQGLFLYSSAGKLLKKLDKKSGLNTNIITAVLVDGVDLFIGTNLGLIKAGLPELKTVKIYNESEGMFNWECREKGLEKLADGSLMIATTNGPYVYHPAKDLSGQYTSGVLTIADFCCGANGENHFCFSPAMASLQLPEEIPYKDREVTITLSGVSQRNPQDILYHYQLQGYDSMWVTVANPVITFDDLEPGDYRLRAYLTTGNFTSKPVFLKFSILKPLSGQLWFQAAFILLLSGLCWLLLTVGNRIYQKYIQTKMLGKLEADVVLKQQLTAQSLAVAQANFENLHGIIKPVSSANHRDYLTTIFLKDINNRIELLWKKDALSLEEFHRYFDDLLAEYATGAKIYHKLSADEKALPVTAAFQLLQVFSLYLFIHLYQNGSTVFSLDSETKSSGHLLLRFYSVTHVASAAKASAYNYLKDAIETQKPVGVTIEVIENLEFGNMLVAELHQTNHPKL